jgi:hypothetical protein
MIVLIHFIIFISNIICIFCINSYDDFFISKVLKRFISPNNFEKIQKEYNINIQLIENNNITNEIYLKNINISDKVFSFYYSGKFFYLNDTNLDSLSTNNDENKWIFLLKSYSTYNNYINYNRSLIKYLSKVIIVPKNSSFPLNKEKRYCILDLSIYLIEVEEEIFNQLINKCIDNEKNNSNYIVKIKSKNYDIIPMVHLFAISRISSLALFIIILIYRYLFTYRQNINDHQRDLFDDLMSLHYLIVFIVILLISQLELLNQVNGFINDDNSFIGVLLDFYIIIVNIFDSILIFRIFSGIGIGFKQSRISRLMNIYITGVISVFDILFRFFASPQTIPEAFYIFHIISHILKFSVIIFYSLKNLIFLLRAFLKIRKKKGRI